MVQRNSDLEWCCVGWCCPNWANRGGCSLSRMHGKGEVPYCGPCGEYSRPFAGPEHGTVVALCELCMSLNRGVSRAS